MSFWHRKSVKEQTLENRQKRLNLEETTVQFSWKSFLYYSLFFGVILLIAFWKQSPIDPQLYLNRPSKIRLVSSIDFDYISDIRTRVLKEQRRSMVSPVYKVDISGFRNFSQKIEILKNKLAKCAGIKKAEEKDNFLNDLVHEFDAKHKLSLEKEDLKTLLSIDNSLQRNRLLDECLFLLQETVQKGIFDDMDLNENEDNFEQDDATRSTQSLGNALRSFRMNLFIMDIEYEVASALLHIFKYGLTPNLVYDKIKTQEKINRFVEKTPNVHIKFLQGNVIVENGQIVTPEIYESYLAYLSNLENKDIYISAYRVALFKKIFLLGLLFTFLLFVLKILPSRLNTSLRMRVGTCILVVFNILLIRLVYIFCSRAVLDNQCSLVGFSSFLVPTFLTSLLITSLIDVEAGLVCTFFVIGVKTLIVYGTLESLLLDLLTGVLMIFLCRKVKYKSDIIKASVFSYLALIVMVFLYDLFMQNFTLVTCLQQCLAILVSGGITLLLAMNLIPILEKAFHYTTNITFLGLTDYNHPLLRKLQLVAPGSYHHSLMVAALSEKAAKEIGANALLCRCCALYHDIGKMVKPEYFTENQKGAENPHTGQKPSLSAIVLKSHVKEGVELAKAYKLPKIIIDVIQQHHGTSIMQYFYKKALLLKQPDEEIDKNVFQYDGPVPQFKESAIISLADAIEAASRSLEKVTSQSVRELIDKIVKDRIETEQLNECNITLQELWTLKQSFEMTLLSMMHSRISYDNITLESLDNKEFAEK